MRMKLSFFSLCIIAVFVTIKADKKVPLPPEFKPCPRDSEDFGLCLKFSIQEAWPSFVKGIPELDVPSLDPYVIDEVDTDYNNDQVHGHMNIKNAVAYGALNMQFLSVTPHFDDDHFNLGMDIKIPKLFVEGDYIGTGFISSFRIGGEGQFNISMEGIRVYFDIEGHVENDVWVIDHFKVRPDVSNMKIWFSDVFNGNEELNKAALSLANEYWPIIFDRSLPFVTPVIDTYLTDFANRVFSKLSFSELFPLR